MLSLYLQIAGSRKKALAVNRLVTAKTVNYFRFTTVLSRVEVGVAGSCCDLDLQPRGQDKTDLQSCY